MCRSDGARWKDGWILKIESTELAGMGGREGESCNVHLRFLIVGVCGREDGGTQTHRKRDGEKKAVRPQVECPQ